MSFAREKRLLLGVLAALAPIPLPFNEVLIWPLLALYEVLTAWFLYRAWKDRPGWLPPWAMNLLGLLYLPFFVFDLLALGGGRLVVPVVHLALFSVVVKLFSLQRERDKWQTLIGVFFLFLAAMATSVHPTIVLYLLVFLGCSLFILARFAHLHLLAGFRPRSGALPDIPLRGVLALSMLLSVILSVPLFAVLPRVRSPYIVGHGLVSGPQSQLTGFSDEVTLDSIGRIRTSREVAARIQFETLSPSLIERRDGMRFRGATFDLYRGNRWERTPVLQGLRSNGRRGSGSFELGDDPVRLWAEIWLQPLASRALILPVETVRLELEGHPLFLTEGGTLTFPYRPAEVIRYRVGLASDPVSSAPPPKPDGPTLDTAGVSAAMAELAARVMGEGSTRERVERLERHLSGEYTYTLDFVGRLGENPLEDFLFRYKSGHCEYFATAMVLMLRSQGVPARLVTGFLGAEYNPLEGYFILRQGNAHVWVEAYLPEEGSWRQFEPTPPGGRPTGGTTSLWSMAQQTYDYVLFRWDRYVLSYDFQDQIQFLGALRDAWAGLWSLLGSQSGETPVSAEAAVAAATPEAAAVSRGWPVYPWVLATLLVGFAGAVFLILRQVRRPLTVEGAYRRLRLELERTGVPVDDTAPPLDLRRRALERHPRAAASTGRVIDLYVQEAYAGHGLDDEEKGELKVVLTEAIRELRRAG